MGRINYSTVISQANTIKDLSSSLEDEISSLENLFSRIKNEWKGPASTEFQKQLRSLIDAMRSTKSDMSSVSNAIKNAANEIDDEDEEAEREKDNDSSDDDWTKVYRPKIFW